jgi:RNA polymerase primary sigma factor
MATKVANGAETVEGRDEAVEGVLLDIQSAAVKKLVARGKERGYVTYDELNAALPPETVSSETIEDTMAMLNDLGINVVENEESEDGEVAAPKPAAKADEEEEEEGGGNVDEANLGRTDDPGPPVPARDGQRGAAVARGRDRHRQAIEAGRDMMIGGLCEAR